MKGLKFIWIATVYSTLFLGACKQEQSTKTFKEITQKPVVEDNGLIIKLPDDTLTLNFFKTTVCSLKNIEAEITAPARVVATVTESEETQQNLILFEHPDLTANYTLFLQHAINIKQYQQTLNRVKELAANGAATGKDIIEAQTNLANEQAAIIEHEAKLRLAGFEPDALKNARNHTVWVISDLPENQLEKITTGASCKIYFTSYPGQTFNGKIESIGDLIDNVTRMVKVRISVENANGRLKAGMFAIANYGIKEGNFIAIPKSAVVTVQSKNYTFVKTGKNIFKRTEITIGQQIGDFIIVLGGLNEGEEVAVEGVMQLKGLSFGF